MSGLRATLNLRKVKVRYYFNNWIITAKGTFYFVSSQTRVYNWGDSNVCDHFSLARTSALTIKSETIHAFFSDYLHMLIRYPPTYTARAIVRSSLFRWGSWWTQHAHFLWLSILICSDWAILTSTKRLVQICSRRATYCNAPQIQSKI